MSAIDEIRETHDKITAAEPGWFIAPDADGDRSIWIGTRRDSAPKQFAWVMVGEEPGRHDPFVRVVSGAWPLDAEQLGEAMRRLLDPAWFVEVVSLEHGLIVYRSSPIRSERQADRIESGLNINLDHERFFTRCYREDSRPDETEA